MTSSFSLPPLFDIQLKESYESSITTESSKELLVEVTSLATSSNCPLCGLASQRIHSYYYRTLTDLPVAGQSFQWHLKARKFMCLNQHCARCIFTERFQTMIQPYARCSQRCSQQQTQLICMTGAHQGQRVAALFGLRVSASTLLRRIAKRALPVWQTPRVLGVDDFAFRKGTRYGTILVDLEKHQVIDLLPDRETNTLKKWLEDHPGVEIVSRDRASAYALAATQAVPEAVQVADRWHLLKNLGEALQRFLDTQQPIIRQVSRELAESDNLLEHPVNAENSDITSPAPELTHRQLNFQQAKQLQQQGYSIRSVAKHLGLARNTIRNYFRWTVYPERVNIIRRSSGILGYESYLQNRWRNGEQRIAHLHKELRERGFKGSAASVFRLVKTYPRQVQPTLSAAVKSTLFSSRQLSYWISRPLEEIVHSVGKRFMEHLLAICPLAQVAHELACRFRQLMELRQREQLSGWLEKAHNSGIAALRHFSRSLGQDYWAVEQAFCSEWSNGQVEGQVNRLKTIKRRMYGRSSFELLRKCVVGVV